jgi:hypothetical protein
LQNDAIVSFVADANKFKEITTSGSNDELLFDAEENSIDDNIKGNIGNDNSKISDSTFDEVRAIAELMKQVTQLLFLIVIYSEVANCLFFSHQYLDDIAHDNIATTQLLHPMNH